MAQVELPGGHTAEVFLGMGEFRKLWSSGAIHKLQDLAGAGGDLGEAYPVLAKAVVRWDLVDQAGAALDPGALASYDQIEAPVFLQLVAGVARYLGGVASKN